MHPLARSCFVLLLLGRIFLHALPLLLDKIFATAINHCKSFIRSAPSKIKLATRTCWQSSRCITVLTGPFRYKLSVRTVQSECRTSAQVYVMSPLFFCEYMNRIEKLSFAKDSVKFEGTKTIVCLLRLCNHILRH